MGNLNVEKRHNKLSMLTESDLLEYLCDQEAEPVRFNPEDQQMVERKRLAESRRAMILLLLKNESWDDLAALINMHRDKLKDIYGLDFLAYMLGVLPHRIYILLVRLFNVESELHRYKIDHVANIQYEDVVIEV